VKEDYTGHERDGETGLHYAGARYYMSALGRWTSVDPLAGEFPAWSGYHYVRNDPLALTDPTGMAPSDWYKDRDGSYKHDPEVTSQADLGEGQTYLGEEVLVKNGDDTEYLCGDLSGLVAPRLSICLQPLTSGILFAGLEPFLRHSLWNQKPLGAVSKEMGIAGLGQQNDRGCLHDPLSTHRFSLPIPPNRRYHAGRLVPPAPVDRTCSGWVAVQHRPEFLPVLAGRTTKTLNARTFNVGPFRSAANGESDQNHSESSCTSRQERNQIIFSGSGSMTGPR